VELPITFKGKGTFATNLILSPPPISPLSFFFFQPLAEIIFICPFPRLMFYTLLIAQPLERS
jgi:hypothetical protein